MDGDITVYFNNRMMIISEKTKTMFGLKQGDTIETEDKFWEILWYNSTFAIAEIDHELEIIESLKNLKWEN